MKTIHFINLLATLATLLLYLLIFPGMAAQLLLGPLQLILALIISFKYYRQLDRKHQLLVRYYWLAALLALIIAGITSIGLEGSVTAIIGLCVVPMIVACYFLYVTTKLDNHLSYEP